MNDDGRWGVIDKMGRPITECMYRGGETYMFQEGRWLCSVEHPETRKHGLMDQEGNMVLPFSFAHGLLFSEGLASMRLGEDVGFIDIDGNEVIEPIFLVRKLSMKGWRASPLRNSRPRTIRRGRRFVSKSRIQGAAGAGAAAAIYR